MHDVSPFHRVAYLTEAQSADAFSAAGQKPKKRRINKRRLRFDSVAHRRIGIQEERNAPDRNGTRDRKRIERASKKKEEADVAGRQPQHPVWWITLRWSVVLIRSLFRHCTFLLYDTGSTLSSLRISVRRWWGLPELSDIVLLVAISLPDCSYYTTHIHCACCSFTSSRLGIDNQRDARIDINKRIREDLRRKATSFYPFVVYEKNYN